MPGCNKRARKKNTSSGKRVLKRTEKQLGRRSRPIADTTVYSFIKFQERDLWPSQDVADKYASLNTKRHNPGPPRKRPAPLGFPLLETLIYHTNGANFTAVKKLLVAASLKYKRVKRHPNWLLQRVYNLKGTPIVII